IRDFHVTGVQTCALPILAWTRILARAITDLDFRESVRKDPAAALKDAGVIAPDLAEAIKSLSPKFEDAMKLAEVLGSTSNAAQEIGRESGRDRSMDAGEK